MFKIGFEVEAFLFKDLKVQVPEMHMPRDAYPGLLEFRGRANIDIWEAWASVEKEIAKFKDKYPEYTCDFKHEHTFSSEDLVTIRKRMTSSKTPLEICNLYGKLPRHLGNKTLASCQVNLSNLYRDEYKDKEVYIPPQYRLLNIPKIIKALDTEFKDEIKKSKRQPGFYAIKDEGIRLEYRSLPNFVWCSSNFITRLNRVLKNVYCN